MKVFLISNMYPSAKDKLFGVFVKNFKEELEKQGVAFSRIAVIKGKSKSAFKKGISYFKHYIKNFNGFFSSDYDLVYVHYLSHHVPILFFLLPFKNKPLVVNMHGNDFISIQNYSILGFFAKIILKKTDLLVVPSSYFKDEVLRCYPFLAEHKIFVSPSGGIDMDKFYKIDSPQKNEVLTLGFVSRFIKEKGWQIFLEALLILKQNKLPFKAIIAGKGPDEEKIKNFITKNQLENEIDFLGFVKQEELVNLYNELDLYIFPTYRKSESLGLTGVEAMACGTPIIASNIAGPSTYIINGENGFLFPPKDAESLKDKIMDYVNLPQFDKDKMRDKALSKAQGYEKSAVASQLKTRLQKLLKNKREI